MKKVCFKALMAFAVVCTVTLFISTAAFAMPGYDLTDLGIPVGDYTGTTAKGINDSGQVAGTLHSHDHPDVGDDHNWAFVWHKTTGFQVLGDPGYKYLEAMGINNSGQVVGGARAYSGNNYALFWENGSITNLGIGRANDINNSGQVVVGNQSAGNSFIWDSSNGKQFLFGSDYIYPWGINDLGQVVGEARNPTPGFDTQAFIWDASNGLQFLYQPAEYMTSSARDMNNSGQVVGMAHDANYPHSPTAVLWNDANTIVKLSEYPASAYAINEAGQIVGQVSMPGGGGYNRGFIWDEVNGLRDLTGLVSPYQGLEFIGYAADINEAGQIVATARIDGLSHAVLLTPSWEAAITRDLDYYINIKLSDTFSFDYWWEMGQEPEGFNLDILFFSGGEWKKFIGWKLNFAGSSTEWETASFMVPKELRGLETQLRFQVFDLGADTDPTVWLRNIASNTAPVPEPATMLLLASGLVGLAGLRRRFRK